MRFYRQLFTVIMYILVNAYYIICFLTNLVCRPFIKLYQWIRDEIQSGYLGTGLDDLDDIFHHFNGFISFSLFIISAVYALVLLLMRIGNANALADYLQTLIFHTPIGSFLGFFSEGLNFTPATAVSIAFTSALFSACMGDEEPDGFIGYPIRFLRHVVFFVGFAHLAVVLSGMFEAIGNWGYSTIISLFNAQTSNFFTSAGKILLLILLGYPALAMLLMAIKEYMECIGLGIVFLLLAAVLTLVIHYFFDWSSEAKNTALSYILLFILFAVDLFRPYVDSIFDQILSPYSLFD